MMKLESVYKRLHDLYVNTALRENNDIKELLEEIEKDIALDTCYKVSPRNRVNAIKRIIKSIPKEREYIKGFGYLMDFDKSMMDNNKFVITDSYHLVCIKEDINNLFNMDLKLITLNEVLMEKFGKDKIIYKNYPSVKNIISCNNYISYDMEEIDLNLDDIESFYKLHKSFKDVNNRLYVIVDSKGNKHSFDIKLLKNVIDVICNCSDVYNISFKCYMSNEDYRKPLYIVNNIDEVGLVLPVRTF